MPTHQELIDITHSNAKFTLGEIRDALPPDLDHDALMREALQFDKAHFEGRTRAEVIAICLGMLMANLLPD